MEIPGEAGMPRRIVSSVEAPQIGWTYSSLNLFSINCISSVQSASSSSPMHSIVSFAPYPAASIITPIMLLALTRMLSRIRKNIRLVPGGDFGELGCGTNMQSQPVHENKVLLDHDDLLKEV